MNTNTNIDSLPTWYKSEAAYRDMDGNIQKGGNIRILHDGTNAIKAVTTQYKIHQPKDIASAVSEAFDTVGVELGAFRMSHNNAGLVISSKMQEVKSMPVEMRKVGDSVGSMFTILSSAFGSTKAMQQKMVLACLNGMVTARTADSLVRCHRSPLDVAAWVEALIAMIDSEDGWFERIKPYFESGVGGDRMEARAMFSILFDKERDLVTMSPSEYRHALTEAHLAEAKEPTKMVERLMTHYSNGANQYNRNGAWKWLNAVTDYSTHTTSIGDAARREDSALAGSLSQTVDRAYALLDVAVAA